LPGLEAKFETALNKSLALKEIYSYDENFAKLTTSEFTSLERAYNTITDSKYIERWVDQAELDALRQNYSKALVYLQNDRYPEALEFAKRAKKNAISVYRGGLEQPAPQEFDTNILFFVAAALAVLLIILYLFGKRKVIANYVSPKEEEVELHGFDKI